MGRQAESGGLISSHKVRTMKRSISLRQRTRKKVTISKLIPFPVPKRIALSGFNNP
jgi:hypothetical protein